MLRPFRDLLVLTLIMTASCLNVTEDDVTTSATSMTDLIITTAETMSTTTSEMTTTVTATTMTATTTITTVKENLSPSSSTSSLSLPTSQTIVTIQNDDIPKDIPHASSSSSDTVWECPNITKVGVECSCDFPYTLRCTGDRTALQAIGEHLKHSRANMISLLDLTVTGISTLPARFLENVALHGLVVSTGELKRVHEYAFIALPRPLQALGLPNNLLDSVPTIALSYLVGLDRLDLDLCDNLLSQLSPQVFLALPMLRSLRMRGNRLSVSALSALRGLKRLEELDLSNNLLLGPMGPSLLPQMPRLHFLNVSENNLINVQQGALVGLKNLTYLSLSHNQIDVLEDHSFKHLSTLTRLDLANNCIVAVSSASLAHLEKLTMLDLTHNFLRSLTADVIVPLKSLQDLRLDDNDITIVASDVPTTKLHLKRLSLADNPLNCDCTLLEFANWLSNSSLSEEDKASAVCATPPALENGVLTQVSPDSLLCGEPTPPMMTRDVPVVGEQLSLKEFHYDESTGVNLLWHVEQCVERYTCDSLIVYETVDDKEIQLESSPLHCDSRMMRDPCILPVSIPVSLHLRMGHKYRYCVVLLVPTVYDDVSLGLGCSDVIVLEKTERQQQQHDSHLVTSTQPPVLGVSYPRITGVYVNVSDQGNLHVDVALSAKTTEMSTCQLSIVIFNAISAVHRQTFNCSSAFVTVEVSLPGCYMVCASLDELTETAIAVSDLLDDHERSRCVEVVQSHQLNVVFITLAVAFVICVITLLLILRGYNLGRKHSAIQAQCFLPTQEFEITHKAHYIKLLATTKV